MDEQEEHYRRDRKRRGKYYDRERDGFDAGREEAYVRDDVAAPPEFGSIEYQVEHAEWQRQAMIPGLARSVEYRPPGFRNSTPAVQPNFSEARPAEPEWDISGGGGASSEVLDWGIVLGPDGFNQSHVSGSAVKTNAKGEIEAVADPEKFEAWQTAYAQEAAKIYVLTKALRHRLKTDPGFISEKTKQAWFEAALGGGEKLDEWREAYGEYVKDGFSYGAELEVREALAETGDMYAALMGLSPAGPYGLIAAALVWELEDRPSLNQLNDGAYLKKQMRFLQLLMQAEGDPIRTAALISAFEHGVDAGRFAAFMTMLFGEGVAGSKGFLLSRAGLRGRKGLAFGRSQGALRKGTEDDFLVGAEVIRPTKTQFNQKARSSNCVQSAIAQIMHYLKVKRGATDLDVMGPDPQSPAISQASNEAARNRRVELNNRIIQGKPISTRDVSSVLEANGLKILGISDKTKITNQELFDLLQSRLGEGQVAMLARRAGYNEKLGHVLNAFRDGDKIIIANPQMNANVWKRVSPMSLENEDSYRIFFVGKE